MFKKYASIENSYRNEFIDRIKSHGFENHEFIVQEKAHGSNLSYWTSNGIDFSAAKRSGMVEKDEKFYNHDLVLEELKPKFIHIWNQLNKIKPIHQLAIFGEIIGGNYPHKTVEKVKGASKVQKGIFYSPGNIFYAFDIMINAETYLNIEETTHLFEGSGVFYAKTLFKGNLVDCLNFPNEFESTIPKELGLPELKPNICEGVVIKPNDCLFLNNGSRVVLKNKNEKWSENTKFNKVIKPQEALPEKITKLQEAISTYVTLNRFNNVVSKLGVISMNDFGKILGLFNKDIIEDFTKDYHSFIVELEKKEIKLITKSFGKKAVGIVREELKKV
jgi:Rnl2 family RNA ligase